MTAAEFERLADELDSPADCTGIILRNADQMREAAKALRQAAAAMAKDAERYRWLRNPGIDIEVTMQALFDGVDKTDDGMPYAYATPPQPAADVREVTEDDILRACTTYNLSLGGKELRSKSPHEIAMRRVLIEFAATAPALDGEKP